MNRITNKLDSIFSPRSVAVIGASTKDNSVGRAVFSNILFSNYQGIVYPVNPKARGVLGVRAYHSVWDIPGEVDLAIIIVPSVRVPDVLSECGEKGVGGAVVITAGFKEVGGDGIALEKKAKDICRQYNLAMVGPNCLGIINTDPSISISATFARGLPERGNIAFISQSGALGVAALEYAREENIGLSKFVSVGNKADVNECDVLEYLRDDPLTDVILLYLEDVTDYKRFIELSREISGDIPNPKPILAIKSGRTKEGAKAASSHTGALSTSDEAYDSLFIQSGVLRVETMSELFDYAVALANQPRISGKKISIVTNAGGPGIIATDTAVRFGLELARFEEKTTNILKKGLPVTANINNPVDIIGDAGIDRYELAVRAVLDDKNVDGLLVICTPQMMTKMEHVAETICNIIKDYDKPVLASFMGTGDISKTIAILDSHKIPHYRFPETGARALANMAKYSEWLMRPRTKEKEFINIDKDKVSRIISQAINDKRRFLTEPVANDILKAYGFPLIPSSLVVNKDELIKKAHNLGYPLALKVVSENIIHKVDAGGVVLNVKTDDELREAYDKMLSAITIKFPDAKVDGVFLQKMAVKGKEVILGMNRDPNFGPLVMFGMGGTYVEIFKDVSFRLAPIRELSAEKMIHETKSYNILRGYRGEPPSDINAIIDCIERLSILSCDFPEIEELDINPLIVGKEGEGARVVDARIILSRRT